MDRIQAVQALLDKIKGKTYLEIGTDYGNSFFAIHAKRKIAVDPHFKLKLKKKIKGVIVNILNFRKEMFFEVTSDDFFLNNSNLFDKNKLDVALDDGLHTYEQSLKDVLNVLKYLNNAGFIVLHDCNPESESEASHLALQSGGPWCGDVWKTIVHLRSLRSDLRVFVLDCDHGVGVVTRGKPENMLNYTPEDIRLMPYSGLEANRIKLLNLKPENFLEEFIKGVK
ncbi:MAG: class I SAM-dependent methyltransferase [Candidatus Omnitrophica bacterium]|nr:class I SAM-dependent methyltransferase [Candidatus Omnitrophota bacterium]